MHVRHLAVPVLLAVVTLGVVAAPPGAASPRVEATQAFNFDFDDNIFFSNAKIMAWDRQTQQEVEVSTGEFAHVRTQMGKPGLWEHRELRTDAFRYFGDESEHGAGLFARQVRESLEAPGEAWKGPCWDAFVGAMGAPETRRHATIITARGHAPRSILAGLRVLQERGLIPGLPREENIFPATWPGLPVALRGDGVSATKARVMRHLLDELSRREVPRRTHLVVDRAGKGLEGLHRWGFSDDDHGNYVKAREVLAAGVAEGRWRNVKILLDYTGRHDPHHAPEARVLRPDGGLRVLRPQELQWMRRGGRGRE